MLFRELLSSKKLIYKVRNLGHEKKLVNIVDYVNFCSKCSNLEGSKVQCVTMN